MCTARPPCSFAGRASYLGASPGEQRSDDTSFAERAAAIALDLADAAVSLALALSMELRPFPQQLAEGIAILPAG